MNRNDDFEKAFFNEELKNVAKKAKTSNRGNVVTRNAPIVKANTASQNNRNVYRANNVSRVDNACNAPYTNRSNGTYATTSYAPAYESSCSTSNEGIAIIIAVCIVYAVQLFGLFRLGNADFSWYNYLPSLKLQIVFTPIIAWFIMALMGIDWMDTWIDYTTVVLCMCIPLEVMVVGLSVFSPISLFSLTTWFVLLIISIIVGLIIYAIFKD